jgi:hypothetical protein
MSPGGEEVGVDWTEQYEVLRAHAVGEAPVGFVPLGLGVLYQRGVMGWMELGGGQGGGWREEGARGREGGQQASAVDSSPFKLELVQVLAAAALTLSQRRAP